MATPGLRLNKAIAQAGLASRREADRMIRDGEVRVNGEAVQDMGRRIDPATDTLEVDGKIIPMQGTQQTQVWALYKPKGCVSTMHDPEGRAALVDHFPQSSQRLFPIGRLDYDAEGLILLTSDGNLAQLVSHPSHAVEKVYLVKVKGQVETTTLENLALGPVLDGKRRGRVKARVLHNLNDKTWLEVTLHEGINHHIKKMFAKEGHRVLKIKRYRVGPIELGEMRPGETRRLAKEEVAALTMEAH